ncbi:helicase associated domain-containing protein [Streptomyces sp. bgisy126]|uniref:helicase associated domain-containing protein n=1 Tax=Streptomyces sp. bgisy126 TaxID=3413787 RepID=UPI003EBC81E6
MPAIEPRMLFEGDGIGRWLQRQKNPGTWAQLSTEQQERLWKLGVQTALAPFPAPATVCATKGARAKRSRRSSAAWRSWRSGWSGKAPTGRFQGPTERQLRSRAKRKR